MRHCNDANDVGDVVWFDPSVGGTGFILEVYSKTDIQYEYWQQIAPGSSLCSEKELAEMLLRLQRNASAE